MPKSFLLSAVLHDYLVAHSTPLDEHRRALIDRTSALGDVAAMQVAPEQALFLTLLTQVVGPRHAVEVGTFTGMSSLSIALGMSPDAKLVCFDVSDEWTSVARGAWEAAGVDDRIELIIGPALDGLRALPQTPSVDLAFIDADKPNYIAYWEELVPRMRPGGVILVDNVLWRGQVADDAVADENTVALRAFNDHAAADDRVDLVMLPISDGLTLARLRES